MEIQKNSNSQGSLIENIFFSSQMIKVIRATHKEPSIFSHVLSTADDSSIFIIGLVSNFNKGIII